MKRKYSLMIVLGGLFLALAIGFVFGLRDLIREIIARPIVLFTWRTQLVWRSMDPDVIWGIFLLLALMMVLLTFPTFQRVIDRPYFKRFLPGQGVTPDSKPSDNQSVGRLRFWALELQQYKNQPYFTRFSVVELKKLILEAVALREGFSSRYQAEAWVDRNLASLPDAIQLIFQPVTGPRPPQTRIGRFFRGLLTIGEGPSSSARIPDLETIIRFLEGDVRKDGTSLKKDLR